VAAFAAALTLGAFADDARSMPLAEAEVFFELNNTDGDLGIHALIDGDAWEHLEITTPPPANEVILEVDLDGTLEDQGLTELFFESAEPRFDELSPEEFFARFPEGMYRISAETLDGPNLKSNARVTHTMPAPAGNIMVNDEEAAEDCDAVLPEVSAPVVISWDAVTESHPDLGNSGESIQVHNRRKSSS
jgi:hypothetical protein